MKVRTSIFYAFSAVAGAAIGFGLSLPPGRVNHPFFWAAIASCLIWAVLLAVGFAPATKKKYRRLVIRFVTYEEAQRLMELTADFPEPERWVIAQPEEDKNRKPGWVYLERRGRVES